MIATARPTFIPGTAEWVAQRQVRIGGSEVSAVMGLSPWQSPFSLWHQKAGQWSGEADNDAMEWGRRLESAIAQKWQDNHSDRLLRLGQTWTSDDLPFAIASPDRLVTASTASPGDPATAILEVKTAHFADEWGSPGTNEIPLAYRMQCLWYLIVLGLDLAHIAVLIAGSDYREYQISTSEPGTLAEIHAMKAAAAEFIESVVANRRPPIDGHDATYQVIRELHPEIAPGEVELPADLAREFCIARALSKDAKASEQRTASLVADHLGNARRATFLGSTIATRQARGNGTPYLVAARNLPNFEKDPT